MSARVGALALQGGVREHLAALDRLGVEAVTITSAADLDRVDALIIPGGESTTIGRLLRTDGLLKPLIEKISAGLPVFGTCAGLVLLARRVLGGQDDQPLLGALDITVRRNAYGSQIASFETELDVPECDHGAFPAVFIRAPRVESLAATVEVVARLPTGQPVALRCGRILATAFHPELSGDDRFHDYFLGQVADLDHRSARR